MLSTRILKTTNNDVKLKSIQSRALGFIFWLVCAFWFVYYCVHTVSQLFLGCARTTTENNSQQTTKITQKQAQHYHKTRRKIIQHTLHTLKPHSTQKIRNRNKQKTYTLHTEHHTTHKKKTPQTQNTMHAARATVMLGLEFANMRHCQTAKVWR